ncbi:hypothetical protein LX15_005724 [Streptoalloteichus tenebrarius]|uniref:Uncharacterized protein n=1 Tax=Streptoalloteichus tenebrarius (strain ATCC 17920 / DSM 40477 / JCM 4838 / CBS 697.72 / NBRC 16177 / NCIMB 11028 / NRRL B-12390 / A12253. 1 / ISP 5477) TaxID=1933 RepID=A0ABT1I2I6_STRSD|nr:hypothetical protein [Streptoalloteichus tenebrarius]MCP2261993.1 hypothetical protein [Streptoalloteichus tenebrarius]BFF02112.1 hypothetical protein GCM10020241_37870 [Streptoalloteichus tenebrarius]
MTYKLVLLEEHNPGRFGCWHQTVAEKEVDAADVPSEGADRWMHAWGVEVLDKQERRYGLYCVVLVDRDMDNVDPYYCDDREDIYWSGWCELVPAG